MRICGFRLRVGCLAVFAIILLYPVHARAVCFEPKIRVDDEFFVSDLVFTGTLVEDQKIGLARGGTTTRMVTPGAFNGCFAV